MSGFIFCWYKRLHIELQHIDETPVALLQFTTWKDLAFSLYYTVHGRNKIFHTKSIFCYTDLNNEKKKYTFAAEIKKKRKTKQNSNPIPYSCVLEYA